MNGYLINYFKLIISFFVHADIGSGQLADRIIADDPRKNPVGITITQLLQSKVGGDDRGLAAQVSLV